jgi:hypothetical protein
MRRAGPIAGVAFGVWSARGVATERPVMTGVRWWGACGFAIVFGLWAAEAQGQTRYDARLHFRVIHTDHFVIYYHQGEERIANRLAGMVEAVRRDVAAQLALDAPNQTHVVLVNQTDVSNGWSTPVPYNTIEIAATPPPLTSLLANDDDWLRLVFVHEYTHIVQLDRVGGWMRIVRGTLGRNPFSFPNLFLPAWQVEGVATYAESALTGRGRVGAAETRAILDEIAAGGRLMPIDRVGGGLVAWPGGNAPYFYGGAFNDYVASRFGPDSLGQLARATASRLPFFGEGAFTSVVGVSSRTLWNQFQAQRASTSPDTPPPTEVRRLTQDGFMTSGPRYSPGRGPGGPRVLYSSVTPDRFPSIKEIAADRSAARTVTTRCQGESLSTDGRWVFFDQIEFDGPISTFRDVYAADLNTTNLVRLSRGRRMSDPEVSPDGTRLAVVVQRAGDSALAVYRLSRPSMEAPPVLERSAVLTVAETGCHFATPRWSPELTRLAAARQCEGHPPEIVVIDGATGVVTPAVSDLRSRNITPAWSPDGQALYFASDRDGNRFQIFAIVPGTTSPMAPQPVTFAAGGATAPDVSPDGRSLLFVSVTAAGYDVFEAALTFSPAASAIHPDTPSFPVDQRSPSPPASPDIPELVKGDRPYSPWSTLWPRAWSPVFMTSNQQTDVGARVEGSDVLGRHAYRATVTWTIARLAAEMPMASSARPNLDVSYVYGRWRQTVLLSASDTLESVALIDRVSGRVVRADARDRQLFAGVLVAWRRVRLSQSWLAGVALDHERFASPSAIPARDRNALRSAWTLNSSRLYGYSISPEDGIRSTATIERVTPALGADGSATSATVDARAYLPGGPLHSVVAVRLASGVSTGDPAARRVFSLGGSTTLTSPFDFGYREIGMMRGIPIDSRVGAAVAVANLDYRFPLARIERGFRTWPIFLNSLHGAVFADVGAAGATLGSMGSPLFSTGVEIASDVTLGYSQPLTVALGAAWAHDARAEHPNRLAVFLRLGRAF